MWQCCRAGSYESVEDIFCVSVKQLRLARSSRVARGGKNGVNVFKPFAGKDEIGRRIVLKTYMLFMRTWITLIIQFVKISKIVSPQPRLWIAFFRRISLIVGVSVVYVLYKQRANIIHIILSLYFNIELCRFSACCSRADHILPNLPAQLTSLSRSELKDRKPPPPY